MFATPFYNFYPQDDYYSPYYAHKQEELLRRRDYERRLREVEAARQREYERLLRQREYERLLRERNARIIQQQQQQQQQHRRRQVPVVFKDTVVPPTPHPSPEPHHTNTLHPTPSTIHIETQTESTRRTNRITELTRKNAARRIQKAYRRHLARVSSIRLLDTIATQFHETVSTMESSALAVTLTPLSLSADSRIVFSSESKPLLAYEDALLKIIDRLDGISGDDVVRRVRKRIVAQVLEKLAGVDRVKADAVAKLTTDHQPRPVVNEQHDDMDNNSESATAMDIDDDADDRCADALPDLVPQSPSDTDDDTLTEDLDTQSILTPPPSPPLMVEQERAMQWMPSRKGRKQVWRKRAQKKF